MTHRWMLSTGVDKTVYKVVKIGHTLGKNS
jgi:hypothetical protein